MREYHVLNLGAGVQSTTLYLGFVFGLFGPEVQKPDFAIFADTQEEPQAVYEHLNWLHLNFHKEIPILECTKGKLGDDLVGCTNSTGQRFASIPAFTTAQEGRRDGQVKRQC